MIERGERVCLVGARSWNVTYPLVFGKVIESYDNWMIVDRIYSEDDGLIVEDYDLAVCQDSFFPLLADHEKNYIRRERRAPKGFPRGRRPDLKGS